MTYQVYKYPIPTETDFVIEMPSGSSLLSVQLQHEHPQLWALVDPSAPLVQRRLALYGTGHDIPSTTKTGMFVGTFQVRCGLLVFHLFDLGERVDPP